ncbi:hypothetical protein PTTG_09603 [Puccinia triticina 1-1 BBBD Race 1]|uniref:Uncharacterized protein n=2 Tax=Puccinia triticina TaxID=208348 RepID=A0A0C4F8U7_PUCT1|nr:uncharacterized protein PtA15_8A174 [Puccinia triticina]OAV94226.1 hypothetical protein PTTG_09603 [Puccinia triticina 1-1 BBBD Race 1]WAQ87270.1 hypothetical protein PtA15_8A174 [Puccinia triticina]
MLLEYFKSKYETKIDQEGLVSMEEIISLLGKIYNQEGVAEPEDIVMLINHYEGLTKWAIRRASEDDTWALINELDFNLRKVLRPYQAVSKSTSQLKPDPESIPNKTLATLKQQFDQFSYKKSLKLLRSIIGAHHKIEKQNGVARTKDILNLILYHHWHIRSTWKRARPNREYSPERTHYIMYVDSARGMLARSLRTILRPSTGLPDTAPREILADLKGM